MVWVLLILVMLVTGCTQEAPPPPPVPPPPEDLSTWTVPELVQPPAPDQPSEVPAVHEDKPTPAEKVYPYTPGTPFAVQVPVGWPLDILLEPGEQVRNIVGGDRPVMAGGPAGAASKDTEALQRAIANAQAPQPQAPAPTEAQPAHRWEVREGADGEGPTRRSHIFVTASVPGLTTGVIITTTRRTYYLTCQSVKTSPLRVLRWQYPPRAVETLKPSKEPGLLPDPMQPARFHVGYVVEAHGRAPDWSPRYVLDDGKKTYLVYPETTLFGTVPMVRKLTVNGPALVNARQHLNVVILDELVARAELRVGIGEHAEVVSITRGDLHTIECPGDGACPVWPAAATALARRQP